jgi:pimeloyl-ACP methyl ester carboxylesterase
MKLTWRAALFVGVVLVVLCGLAVGVVSYLAYRVVPWGLIHPMRPPATSLQAYTADFSVRVLVGHRDTSYHVRTDDSTVIAVRRLTPTSHVVRATVMIVHGIASAKESALPLAAWCLQLGFDVLLIDQRGHGMSTGTTCSYGYHERSDVLAVLRHAAIPDGRHIILWGNSMGAATVLLAAEMAVRRGDRQPSLVIAESGYSSAPAVMGDFLKQKFGWNIPLLAPMAIGHCSRLLGIDATDIQPERAVTVYSGALLILHGTSDDRVPFYHAERLRKAMASVGSPAYRAMVAFPNTGHNGLREAYPPFYDATIMEAFQSIGL